MQGNKSIMVGALFLVVFGGIMAILVAMPRSAPQSQSDILRETVVRVSRAHNQVLGLMAGPTVKVGGELPPIFKKGDKTNITVLEAGQQNTAIPNRLDELRKDLKDSLDKTPEARKETRATAYSLMGQVLAAKAQYYLRSTENAALKARQAIATIDTGILSVQKRLINIRQITPLTEVKVTAADTMKTDAEADVTRLEGEISTQTSAITKLETERDEHVAASTKYSNEASELRTLSAVAERDERRELQEQSFVKESLANKSSLDAEDAQIKIDRANAVLATLNIELTSAKAGIVSGTGVLDGLAANRETAKGELERETLAMNKTGQKIAGNVDALMIACGGIDAGQASAIREYTAALEAMEQFGKLASVSDSSVEAISSKAGVLMGKALASLAAVSSRKAVAATGGRLKVLWETSAMKGDLPKADEMAAFTGKTQDNENAAGEGFAAAAKLYEEATSKANPRFKWSYQLRELQARRARHSLTGDADDKTRANLIEDQLGELKGFPYVDSAL